MDLHLKLFGGELELILTALKEYAEKYSGESVKAIQNNNSELYTECHDKKTAAWQTYDHIHRAAERMSSNEL